MQIVIDIPEESYIALMEIKDALQRSAGFEKFIINGIPLPKGHGDLKDTEKLKNAFIAWSMAVHGNFSDADIASIIYNSPTIIEADKEVEHE